MNHITRTILLCTLTSIFLSSSTPGLSQDLRAQTALDDYLAKKDPEFAWGLTRSRTFDDHSMHVIDLTSQKWLDKSRVDRPVWKHWLNLVVPRDLETDAVLLFVGGGSNGKPPSGPDGKIAGLARATGSIVAELKTIPNQPLVFHGDGKRRSEDDLIAYAWIQYMKTGDVEWIPRLPMVKSVVRAMDVIQEVIAKETKKKPERFVIAGGSKRGWTTWLTGVDKRVISLIPIVIDVVNVRTSMEHHYAAYGFWAPAIGDYVRHGVIDWHSTKEYESLLRIADPFAYRHRLAQPKFMLNASGDQFFLPDSSQFYFDKLEGENYLRYVPNADHSLRGSDAVESLGAWFQSVATNSPRPKFSWSHVGDDALKVKTETEPSKVVVWSATNPNARDFRLEAIGKVWKDHPAQSEGGGVFIGRVEKPSNGWRAYFVELTFEGISRSPLKFTTDVRVIPNTLPHSEKLREFLEQAKKRAALPRETGK